MPWTSLDGLALILTEYARDMKTNALVMVATTFHNRLRKTIGRELRAHAAQQGLVLDRGHGKLVTTALRNAVRGPEDKEVAWPTEGVVKKDGQGPHEGRTGNLVDHVRGVVEGWRKRFARALPCKTPQKINATNAPVLVEWLFDMRCHLDRARASVKESLPEDASQEEVSRKLNSVFRKGDLKTFGLLPVFSPRAKNVPFSPTGLYYLTRMVHARDPTCLREWPKTKQEVTQDPRRWFLVVFPGLKAFERGDGVTFDNYLRTDGLSVSITLLRPDPPEVPEKAFRPGRGLVPVEHADLKARTPPVVPRPGQRLVGIDPGRRDMVFGVVSHEDHDDNETTLRMSTRQHVHESQRGYLKKRVERLLEDQTIAGDGGGKKRSLLECTYDLPSTRVATLGEFQDYLTASLPVYGAWLSVHRDAKVRLARLRVYGRKERSLDRLCHRICGTRTSLSRRRFECTASRWP